MSELQIGKKKIGNGYPVYIIAEGCDNHMGDVEVAKEMCRQAKLAGADCIKFQHHLPDEEMLKDVPMSSNFDIPLYDFLKQPDKNTTYLQLMDKCLASFFRFCRDDMQYTQLSLIHISEPTRP